MKRLLTIASSKTWLRAAAPLALLCGTLPAQVSVPKIGTARYQDGSIHTVQGLPANMIVAELPLENADAASFSDCGGMVAQSGIIRLLGPDYQVIAEYPTTEKPLLAMDGGLTSALAWLPGAHKLVHWNGERFDAVEVAEGDLDGTVTDIQTHGPKLARLIVEHANKSVSGVSVSLRTGNLVSSELLPGVTGYAVGQDLFVLYASGKDLVADNLRGYRLGIALPAKDLVIERMSTHWLHLYSAGSKQNWALHLTQGEMDLSMLPGLPEPRGVQANDIPASRRLQ